MLTYSEQFDRPPDFRVRYRWVSSNKARKQPVQHMHCDWLYKGDDPKTDGAWMIWPEFESDWGSPIDESEPVPAHGTATMWILDDAIREKVHKTRIQTGVRGFFMAGAARIAEAEIIQLIGLNA